MQGNQSTKASFMIKKDNFPAVDLDKLEKFLLSDKTADDCMMLSDIDGFLTAAAIGPEPINPSEWLPVIFGGRMPAFSNTQEAEEIIGMLMTRYNEILRQVSKGAKAFEPIYWQNQQGEWVADDWAQGFLEAYALRKKSWQPLLDSQEHNHLFMPIAVHMFDKNGKPAFDIENDERFRDLFNSAPQLIPDCVVGIDRFWKKARDFYRGPVQEKVGRNDPCTCGSGKKYKKCCGNN